MYALILAIGIIYNIHKRPEGNIDINIDFKYSFDIFFYIILYIYIFLKFIYLFGCTGSLVAACWI